MMSADLTPPPPARFALGRVLRDSFCIYKDNLFRLVPIAIVGSLLTDLPSRLEGSDATLSTEAADWWKFAIQILAILVIRGLTDAILIAGTLRALRVRTFQLRDAVQGLSRAVPVILVSAITRLPIDVWSFFMAVMPEEAGTFSIVGLVVLISATTLWVTWFVAAPAVIAERLGVLVALKRGAALTREWRWEVFGLIALAGLIFGALDLLVAGIATVAGVSSLSIAPVVSVLAKEYASRPLFSAFLAVLATVSYYTLRMTKEGVTTQELAQIFE